METWDDSNAKPLVKETVLSTNGGVNLKAPLPGTIKPEELDDKLNIKKIVSFIQHDHPINSIQIEKLDDEISTLTLYKIIEKPVDFGSFQSIL